MRIHTVFLSLLLAMSGICVAAGNPVGESDHDRLMRGEILTRTVHEEKSGGAAQVMALFHSDMARVWEVVGYCEKEYLYVRGLEACEVVSTGPVRVSKRHRVNNNWYTPTIDFVFEAQRDTQGHGTFRLVEGNLKVMEGKWGFEPVDGEDAIIVTHEIRVRSRFPAPRWLVRRVLKKDLPNMMACVRGLAAASGNPAQVATDLARCPGDANRRTD